MKTLIKEIKILAMAIVLTFSISVYSQKKAKTHNVSLRVYNMEGKKMNKGSVLFVNDSLVGLKNSSEKPKTSMKDIRFIKSKNSFVEWNFGVAYIAEDDFIFPGTSYLWGQTYINENNLIFEFEAGLALPSIVTGKLGIGKKFNNTKVIVGVRPFPFNLYLQSSFTNGKKGYWVASIEFNPLNSNTSLSFGSRAILNFGYRWNILRNLEE
jgi:hypothetical protein